MGKGKSTGYLYAVYVSLLFLCIAMLTLPNEYYIVAVCVSNDFRGKGIGKALLKSVLRKNWDKRFKLDVLCDNKAAINLYKELGVQIDGKSYKGYAFPPSAQPDCFCMTRTPLNSRANREQQQNHPTTELG